MLLSLSDCATVSVCVSVCVGVSAYATVCEPLYVSVLQLCSLKRTNPNNGFPSMQ